MAGIHFDVENQCVKIGSLSRRPIWVRPWEWNVTPDGYTALFLVRREVYLYLEAQEGDDSVWVGLRAGESAEDSDGLAVALDENGRVRGLARVPLCSCGDRECGDAGVQFGGEIPVQEIEDVFELVDELRDVGGAAVRGKTWFYDGQDCNLADIPR